VGLRAAAREHRREVGVAEGVEVGRRELHLGRPASYVPGGTYGTRARAGPGSCRRHAANGGAGRQLGLGLERGEAEEGSVLNQPQDGNGMAVN
jgi:hypothetical protein